MRTIVRIIGAGLLGGVAVALTMCWCGQQIEGVAEGCADVKVIWARGSGQGMDASESKTFSKQMKTRLALADTDVEVEYHELSYPATGFGSAVEIIKMVTGEDGDSEYARSVRAGIDGLKRYISEESGKCPKMKYVLAGYSQGAQVIGDSLYYLDKGRISYVAFFGDPKLYLPEGRGVVDAPACSGKEISSYNMWAPNCRTHIGAIGSRRPYHPVELEGRVGTWCNSNDFICGSSLNPLENSGHTLYVEEGRIADAAERSAVAVVADFTRKESESERSVARKIQPPIDVAILVDSSSPLADKSWYGKEQVKGITNTVINKGGKVTFISYRDSGSERNAKMICDLNCTEEKINSGLGELAKDRETESDDGLLGAIKMANDELGRSANSVRLILILPRSDLDLVDKEKYEKTIETILKSSPVNIGVVAQEQALNDGLAVKNFKSIISRIGGSVYWYQRPEKGVFPEGFWENALDYLRNRPDVRLARTEYSARIGEKIVFDASGSSGAEANIARYEWDFDGDGKYDKVTESSMTEYEYNQELSGFMVLKAVDTDGEENTRSALIEITDNRPEMVGGATAIKIGADRVRVSWKNTTERYIVITFNDKVLERIEASAGSVEIPGVDFSKPNSLFIQQMSEDGRLSNRLSLKVIATRTVAKVEEPVEEIEVPAEEIKAPETGFVSLYGVIMGKLPRWSLESRW